MTQLYPKIFTAQIWGSSVGHEGHMPLGIYTIMHPSAKLDDKQRELIVAWAEATMDVVAEEEDEEE